MKKIIIIGCPGSGKSTFARALHDATGIPLYHLDMMYWNKDRTKVLKPVFLQRLQNVIEQDCWIIDGNYSSTMELRMKECDTVFFLDYPTEVCLEGVQSRKGKIRPDIPWIEPEGEDNVEFLTYLLNYNIVNRPKVMELLSKYSEKTIVIFNERRDAETYINNLKEKNPTGI